ncbi:hypothetical protein ACKFKG_30120 [Phormidesmis sp. 146-35]
MNNVADCLGAVNQLVVRLRSEGDLLNRHVIEQLQAGVQQHIQGYLVQFEQRLSGRITSGTGGGIDINRDIDVVARDLFTRIHTEIKTGYANIGQALDSDQILQDAALAIRTAREGAQELQNIWRIADHEFGERLPQSIQNRMQDLVTRLAREGFTPEEVRSAVASFRFVDASEQAIRAELNESGELIFRNAMGEIFGPDGKIAQEATKQAGNSPNFSPAMEVIFGSSGKLADAAGDAARGVNLDPALQNLEQEIEAGVTEAMDQAGDEIAAHGAQSLASMVGAGARSLGNVLTSIPQLYESVNQLGEAWDRPLESTEDYMNLFSALGGTITQGVDTIEALAGVTQLASAAQGVFNAVMALNPVVLVVIAVIALIAAIAALIIYWDEVKAALRDNPWLAVIAVLFGLIGVIIVVIAYWDEIKLAVLQAANFISIQVQRIGYFFVGLGTLIGQIWDWIVATVYNAIIGIINIFIGFGASIINFFIGLLNGLIDLANEVIAYIPGVDYIDRISEVNAEALQLQTMETPEINIGAAFETGEIRGGLEGAIAEQEAVVAEAERADEERRASERAEAATAAPPRLPEGGGRPALPEGGGLLGQRPGLPEGMPLAASTGGGGGDQSITLENVTININAERLEADAAQLLSDEIVNRLRERLDALRTERDFRTGVRSAAPA